MTAKNLEAKAMELKDLKAMAEELQAEITAKAVTSNRFDSKAFKAQYNALYEQFIKQSIGYRFSVA